MCERWYTEWYSASSRFQSVSFRTTPLLQRGRMFLRATVRTHNAGVAGSSPAPAT
jgi:hypothetical protein